MDPKPLEWLLDTLAKADGVLPFLSDREACEQVADALRNRLEKINGPIRVLLVHGPDADPLVQWAEDLYRFRHAAAALADSLDEVASGELSLDDIKQERLVVRALLSDPKAVTS